MACREESDWLERCFRCEVNNYPEEYCPPKFLPVPPDYRIYLLKRVQMSVKGILRPTFKMVHKTRYPLPVNHQLIIPPPLDGPPHPSPLPYAEPES